MTLKVLDLISIVLSALILGVFWGPWLALSRSMITFDADVFLAIVHRMDRNLGLPMTVLMPVTLVSIVPVLFISYTARPETFYLTLSGFAAFIVTLLVTVRVEVPIVAQIRTWTIETLPSDWQQLRDRWVKFHLVRVVGGVVGLILLVAGVLFR